MRRISFTFTWNSILVSLALSDHGPGYACICTHFQNAIELSFNLKILSWISSKICTQTKYVGTVGDAWIGVQHLYGSKYLTGLRERITDTRYGSENQTKKMVRLGDQTHGLQISALTLKTTELHRDPTTEPPHSTLLSFACRQCSRSLTRRLQR